MILRSLLAFVLCGVASPARTEEATDGRIDLAALLDSPKRMAAFQEFELRTEPDLARAAEWTDLTKFVEDHGALAVQTFPKEAAGPLYVVTFARSIHLGLSEWPDQWETEARLFAFKPGDPRRLRPEMDYCIFQADGRLIDRQRIYAGDIGDFNGDGRADIAEFHGEQAIPNPIDKTIGGMKVGYFTIRPLGQEQPIFAVLCNAVSGEREDPNPWEAQLIDPDGDGVFDVQIGPSQEGRLQPAATFHWDAARQTWSGPAGHLGDHFRVLDPAHATEEMRVIVEAGGLGLAAKPKDDAQTNGQQSIWDRVQKLTADELSKPYRYESLAKLSDDELIEYMTGRRTAWDVARDERHDETNVVGFCRGTRVRAQESSTAHSLDLPLRSRRSRRRARARRRDDYPFGWAVRML
jgi:hypothetical protein